MAVNFIGGGNQRTRRKSPICRNSPTNFITLCCTPHPGRDSVMIDPDCIYSCRSNYHTITTTTAHHSLWEECLNSGGQQFHKYQQNSLAFCSYTSIHTKFQLWIRQDVKGLIYFTRSDNVSRQGLVCIFLFDGV